MPSRERRIPATLALAAALSLATAASAVAATGPSSSASPYVVRSQPGVVTKSILTVGDEVPRAGGGTYRMVGIPDGLGAFGNGDGTFTLLSNHELGSTAGAVRAHGAAGAFVSEWNIDAQDLSVDSGRDLIQQVATWNTGTSAYDAPGTGVAMNRLCSATLAPVSAFYDPGSGKGYDGRIFTSGEEGGGESFSRAFAHVLDGTSWQLPALGRLAYENLAARPAASESTVVASQDDSTPGQVYIYKGEKAGTGSPVQRAGLTDGVLYGVKVDGLRTEAESSTVADGTPFSLAPLGDVRAKTVADLETASDAAGVTEFLRPEDGAWDPTDPDRYYFVTTDSFDGHTRLWRLTFADGTHPEQGGTIDMLLDGTEGPRMMDNLTVNDRGQVLIQEDPGNQTYLARLWLYSPQADRITEIAHFDSGRFSPGEPAFLTKDEESSGIIDASDILGGGWYLFDVQAHYALPGELVEGGQYLALHVPAGRYPR